MLNQLNCERVAELGNYALWFCQTKPLLKISNMKELRQCLESSVCCKDSRKICNGGFWGANFKLHCGHDFSGRRDWFHLCCSLSKNDI